MYGVLVGLALALASADAADVVTLPKVVDSRLKIELFAAEPDIVTPTGLAIDSRGRVLVVESHTHFRPDDYQGPPADRLPTWSRIHIESRSYQGNGSPIPIGRAKMVEVDGVHTRALER
jgi:hypothetical protein